MDGIVRMIDGEVDEVVLEADRTGADMVGLHMEVINDELWWICFYQEALPHEAKRFSFFLTFRDGRLRLDVDNGNPQNAALTTEGVTSEW